MFRDDRKEGMDKMTIDYVVKLGGSAVTDKNVLEKAKLGEIARAVQIVKMCRQHGRSCIVVHGAGSFGHHHAKEYRVNQGYSHLPSKGRDSVREGFCRTRLSVTKLNHIITEEFVKNNLPAVSHSPCGFWTTEGGAVKSSSVNEISDLLLAGFIPILHGDCVLDTKQGCRILSGDTIIKVLNEEFSPESVIFLSDVAGIFDRPPEQPGAELLRVISVSASGDIDINVKTTVHEQDVTGGIKLKLQSAIDIVRKSGSHTKVFICHVNSRSAENACLYSDFKDEPGTVVQYR